MELAYYGMFVLDEIYTAVITRRQVPSGSASLGNGGGYSLNCKQLFARMPEAPHRDFVSRTTSRRHQPHIIQQSFV